MFYDVCRVCPKRVGHPDECEQQFSASAPPASLSLLGNFEVQQTNSSRPGSQGQMLTWLLSALKIWKKKMFAVLFHFNLNLT